MNDKFIEFIIDLLEKIFQIVFAMLVVGMLISEKFNIALFLGGFCVSFVLLTMAITLHYNYLKEGEK